MRADEAGGTERHTEPPATGNGLPPLSRDGSIHVTDEVFNTCSHLAAAVFSLLGWVLLVVGASAAAKPWHIVCFSIYGLTLFALFLTSTLHHGVNASERVQHVLRLADYGAIFLLIAGSLTPICLIPMRGTLGWSLFGVVWGVTAAGIVLKLTIHHLPKTITNTLYLALGWMTAVVAWPVYRDLGVDAFGLLVAGGLLYSVGAIFFAMERPNPIPGRFGFHEIWHLFVIGGAVAHYLLLYFFILPLP